MGTDPGKRLLLSMAALVHTMLKALLVFFGHQNLLEDTIRVTSSFNGDKGSRKGSVERGRISLEDQRGLS